MSLTIANSCSLCKNSTGKNLLHELADAVAPGIGDTNFLRTGGFPEGELERAVSSVPTGRTTTPEDIGNLVAYLASDISRQVVGQTYLIDGGHI